MKRKPEFYQTTVVLIVSLLAYALVRALFYLLNTAEFNYQNDISIDNATIDLLTTAFLTGLRFDVATLALSITPGLLLLSLGSLFAKQVVHKLGIWLVSLPTMAGLVLCVGDSVYFRHAHRRQTDELWGVPQEALTAVSAELTEWWWLLVLLLLLLALYHTLLVRLTITSSPKHNPMYTRANEPRVKRMTKALLYSSSLILLAFVAARGGLQNRPLRPAMAFKSDNLAYGHLALNSLYTFLWSSMRPLDSAPQLLDTQLALELTAELTNTHKSEQLNSTYPFLRTQNTLYGKPTEPFNVVLLIFESWNASQTGAITGEPSLTPNFDSLARKGLLYTNFAANGSRSIHAFPAILASLPNIAGDKLIHSSLEMNQIRGLGTVLKENGYNTGFAMGADPTSMGFDSYAKACGFDEHLSITDYPNQGTEFIEPHWGVYDDPFLVFLEERIASKPEPFAQVFFSLTSHNPYQVPESFADRFPLPETASAGDLQERALRYADHALGEFIRKASTRPYYNRTLFVITADHVGWKPGFSGNNQHEMFHIPLLLYAPGLVQAGLDTKPASQIDILPTIVDRLGINTELAGLGSTTHPAKTPRYSISASGSVLSFTIDTLLLVSAQDRAIGLYNYQQDSGLTTNLIKSEETAKESIWRYFAAFYQTGVSALIENRICPPQAVLDSLMKSSR